MSPDILPSAHGARFDFTPLLQGVHIAWLNTSGAYVTGLHQCFPIEIVACLDDGADLDLLAETSALTFLRVESASGRRVPMLDRAIEDVIPAVGVEIESAVGKHPRDSWVFVCPRPCRALERFVAGRFRALLHPADLGIRLFSKRSLQEAVTELELPRLPGSWLHLANNFPLLAHKFGVPFVVQEAYGASGSGTSFINDAVEFQQAAARLGDKLVWVAPHVGQLTLNVAAAAVPNDVLVAYPSVQLTGLFPLTTAKATYCGNDYASAAHVGTAVIDGIREQTQRIGAWLTRQGFHGFFGLDYVIDGSSGSPIAVDLNPRWQGSTALATQAELLAGRLPLAIAELAWKLGLLSPSDLASYREQFFQPLEWSQMILRSLEPQPAGVSAQMLPGLYSVEQDDLCFSRKGCLLAECSREEYLLAGAVVRQSRRVEPPGARLATIFRHGPVYDLDHDCLTSEAATTASRFYAGFDLASPISPREAR
jgi:hypothetical protein